VRIEQTVALMRLGIKERIIHPRCSAKSSGQIDHQIVSDPKASPLYKPFTHFPSWVSASDQARLAEAAQETIATA